MDNQVEEIKQKLDIVNVISKFLPLKKRGRHYLANCPFHNEKTPSFTVSPELQIFKCFGCGKAGDIFTFLQEYEHIEFKDALEQLAAMAGITLVKNTQNTQSEIHQKRLIEINEHSARFYNFILTSHPLGKSALDYVINRGITLESIKLFKIGYSPSDARLIVNYLQKKDYQLPELIATGSFGYSQYHSGQLYDRFQDRLVFPLADFRNRVLGFSGRILPTTKNQNLAKYINSPETEIYHKGHLLFGLNLAKEAIRTYNSVIVVEGEFDMLSPYQLGIHHIVAVKGTAFTIDQLQLLRRYAQTLILGLDSDFAGDTAATKSIQLADQMGFDVQVLTLGDKYKDPDEAAHADPDFFRNQLAHTIPVWDFLIQSAIKKANLDTIRGKKDVLSFVLPFLAKISNLVIRSDYYRLLANEIGSSESAVSQEARQYETAKNSALPNLPPPPPRIHDESKEIGKSDKIEEYLLTLIFGAKKPTLVARKHQTALAITTSARLQPIIKLLLSLHTFNPSEFQAALPAELRPAFESIYLQATTQTLEPHRRSFEIKKASDQIQILKLKAQLTTLSGQIARLEADDNQPQLEKLEREYNTLLTKLSQLQTQKL